MAKSKTKNVPTTQAVTAAQDAGIMMVMMFVSIMFVNALVLYVANMWSPKQVVLGNQSLSLFWALVLSSGVTSLISTFLFPFLQKYSMQMYHMLKPMEWMAVYLVINFIIVWLVTRVSEVFGLGVSSWMVVLLIAVVMDVVQGAAMMMMPAPKKS